MRMHMRPLLIRPLWMTSLRCPSTSTQSCLSGARDNSWIVVLLCVVRYHFPPFQLRKLISFSVGAAAAKPRMDVVLRNAIQAGDIPGPRYLANGQEVCVRL